MVPTGGEALHNTINEAEALQAVKAMNPKMVIPCHYNCPAFFTRKNNSADEKVFSVEVEKTGSQCVFLHNRESIVI